jgi:hypothetical protein
MKLRIVCPRAVAWRDRSRAGMLALAAAGALALTAATALAPGLPAASVQAAVASGAPRPAQAQSLPLSGMRRAVAPASVAPSAGAVPATAAPPTSLSVLDGVFCTSKTRCWAVGGQLGAGGMSIANQVMRWNGKTWRQFSVPNPGGTSTDSFSELYAVRCLAAANCWAVGERSGGAAGLDQALHWNGTKWKVVATPNPGGKGSGKVSEL